MQSIRDIERSKTTYSLAKHDLWQNMISGKTWVIKSGSWVDGAYILQGLLFESVVTGKGNGCRVNWPFVAIAP